MKKSRFFKFITASLFMLSLTIFTIASAGANSNDYLVPLSEQLEFRKEFGLDTSLSKLETVNKLKQFSKTNEFQVPLTDEEENELKERFVTQTEEIPKVKSYLEKKYQAGNVSLYIDQSTGGEIVIRLKEAKASLTDSSSIKDELKKVSTKLNYRIEKSEYTEQELDKLSSELWSKKEDESSPSNAPLTFIPIVATVFHLSILNS